MKTIKLNVSKKDLGMIIYTDSDIYEDFTTEMINEDIQNKVKLISSLYDKIDSEDYENISVEELYALGDIHNLVKQLRK